MGGTHLNRTDDNKTIECYFEKSIPELNYNESKLVTCDYEISQCIYVHNKIKLEGTYEKTVKLHDKSCFNELKFCEVS